MINQRIINRLRNYIEKDKQRIRGYRLAKHNTQEGKYNTTIARINDSISRKKEAISFLKNEPFEYTWKDITKKFKFRGRY